MDDTRSPQAGPARLVPVRIDPAQQALFAIPDPCPRSGFGYRGPVAATAAGITYRQLDHWARTGLVAPSIRTAGGSGTTRLYSLRDILVLQVVRRLLETGVSLAGVRASIATLRERGIGDLSTLTLMSDGISVYECANDDDVIDLVNGGQGVFGIAIGAVWSDVTESMAHVPVESAAEDAPPRPAGRWLRSVG